METNLGTSDTTNTTWHILHSDTERLIDLCDQLIVTRSHEGEVKSVEGGVVRVS